MQMLQAVSNIAPRGVYVCGSATSTSGLTVNKSLNFVVLMVSFGCKIWVVREIIVFASYLFKKTGLFALKSRYCSLYTIKAWA